MDTLAELIGSSHPEPLDEEGSRIEQERLIITATELVERLLTQDELTRAELARRLERTRGYVTQVLGGKNLTLRTLSEFVGALGRRVRLSAEPVHPVSRREVEVQTGRVMDRTPPRPIRTGVKPQRTDEGEMAA